MATHAGAMLITAPADRYTRRDANDPRYSFGTGKPGFAGAIVLALVAVLIGWESLQRLANPVGIRFDEAIDRGLAGADGQSAQRPAAA